MQNPLLTCLDVAHSIVLDPHCRVTLPVITSMWKQVILILHVYRCIYPSSGYRDEYYTATSPQSLSSSTQATIHPSMDFGEKLSPTAAIASILSAYPFSVGLLRELLQNSDDAKASKQVRASIFRLLRPGCWGSWPTRYSFLITEPIQQIHYITMN